MGLEGVDGDATSLWPETSQWSSIVFGLLLVWGSLGIGFGLGFLPLSLVLEVVVGRWKLGTPLLLDIEEVLTGATDANVHLFVADVIMSFDIVDGRILDRVLSSIGLLAWFRNAYFEYHAQVRLRFKLASGLGEPWTRDEGIPQGCPLSMMLLWLLYLPWCRYLAALEGLSHSSMLTILSVSLGILTYSCVLLGLPLAESRWLVRSLHQVSVSF